ncbi:MAG TPA: amino acid ABC transporter substrate-binding protein [Solirubrobacteraceae bacterium]|nr:amino acid ABC transporter substrate-binding protein [Solirubrobacteraceae bacterium]
MRGIRWVAALAALVLGAGAIGACGSDNGDGGGTSSGGSTSGGTLKIGASLPLTGEFSEPGKAAQQGYKVWEAMTNEKGGLLGKKVKFVIRDDASDQNTVVADYNALISREKVDMLMGTFSSLLNIPASTVAERNRMLYVEPAGGAPEIFERGYKMIFFAQQATADKQGDLFADWVLKLPADKRPKTAAYPTLDDPFAIPVLEGIRSKLEPAGIKTVQKSTYPADTSNFDSIANAVKAKNPDLVVHGATFADGVGFVRALKKVGFTPKMLFQTSAPSFGEQYLKGVGQDATEGVFYAVSHTPEAATPGNKEFVAKYNEMFGTEVVPEDAADAFAAAEVMAAAAKAVGSVDRDSQTKMADWLRANQVDTILGPLSWDDKGRPEGEFLIGQWQGGKAEIVLPKEAATSDKIIETYGG